MSSTKRLSMRWMRFAAACEGIPDVTGETSSDKRFYSLRKETVLDDLYYPFMLDVAQEYHQVLNRSTEESAIGLFDQIDILLSHYCQRDECVTVHQPEYRKAFNFLYHTFGVETFCDILDHFFQDATNYLNEFHLITKPRLMRFKQMIEQYEDIDDIRELSSSLLIDLFPVDVLSLKRLNLTCRCCRINLKSS